MKKTNGLFLIVLLILSCSEKKYQKTVIDGFWISDIKSLDTNLEYNPNTLFTFEEGKGEINNLGVNKMDFEYEVVGDKIEVVIRGNKKGVLKIISVSEEKLELRNFKDELIELKRLTYPKLRKSKILNELKGNLFKFARNKFPDIQSLENEKSGRVKYLYFKDKDVAIIEEIYHKITLAEENPDLAPFRFINKSKGKYKVEVTRGIGIISIKGLIKELNYPLVGLVRLSENQNIKINTYISNEIREVNLIKEEVEEYKSNELVGEWTNSMKTETLTMNINGTFSLKNSNREIKGDWKSYDKGGFIVFKNKSGYLRYGTKDKGKNRLVYDIEERASIEFKK